MAKFCLRDDDGSIRQLKKLSQLVRILRQVFLAGESTPTLAERNTWERWHPAGVVHSASPPAGCRRSRFMEREFAGVPGYARLACLSRFFIFNFAASRKLQPCAQIFQCDGCSAVPPPDFVVFCQDFPGARTTLCA